MQQNTIVGRKKKERQTVNWNLLQETTKQDLAGYVKGGKDSLKVSVTSVVEFEGAEAQ